MVRLVGGDRLAPTPEHVSGRATFAALEAAGSSTISLPTSGAGALEELLGHGSSTVALPTTGAVAFTELEADGSSTVALPAAAAVSLDELRGDGSSNLALLTTGAAPLPEMGASGGASVFRPEAVPAVAAGYFWDPAQASNSDLATFSMPEGNGKTSYNMITPSVDTAPVIGTVNGRAVITYTNRTAPSIDDQARTPGKVARGWTGATYLWGWFMPPTGGCGFVLSHWRTATNFGLQLNTSDVRIQGSDGTAKEQRFGLPPGGYAAGPVFYEAIFDPLQATATNRLQLFFNRVQQTPTITTSFGTSLLDTSEFISFAGPLSDGSGFNITGSYSQGVAGIANGIPSSTDRDRLFNHRRLA